MPLWMHWVMFVLVLANFLMVSIIGFEWEAKRTRLKKLREKIEKVLRDLTTGK